MKLSQYIYMLLLLIGSQIAFAEASSEFWPNLAPKYIKNKAIETEHGIELTGPRRAESGTQVPITLKVDPDKNIKKISIIVDANPVPLTATYFLTALPGELNLSTRIRMETDSFVRAIAESEDGKIYMSVIEIRASGGCGGTIDSDEVAVRANAGKVKLRITNPMILNQPNTFSFQISHPQFTGLQRDLASGGYRPAFYINKAVFKYNGVEIMNADLEIGTSENPYVQFSYTPKEYGKFEVSGTDNEGKPFDSSIVGE